MQIKMTNGNILDCVGVHGWPIEYQGVKRDSLTFLFNENQSIDYLNDVFSPEKCKDITIISDSGEDIHSNYTIRIGMGKGYKNIALANTYSIGSSEEDMKKYCWVQMAQTSLTERELQNQSDILELLLISELEK